MRWLAALILFALAGCTVPVRPPRASAASSIKIDSQSEWAEFADYLRGAITMGEARWYAILDQSRVAPLIGTQVRVTFNVNAEGEVTVLKTQGDAGHQGTYACTGAVAAGFGGKKWTEAMIAKLGREQTLTFTFYYN